MNPIQALIEQLSNPKPHHVPGSTQPVIKPPSPLELRAAKALFEAYKDRLPSVEVVIPPITEPTLNYIL